MATAQQTVSKGRLKPLLWLFLMAVVGVAGYFVWKYRFLIKGFFSGGNASTGPTETGTENLINDAVNKPGGLNPASEIGSNVVGNYWPLKKGAKNENVRWVQIIINKIPNTGAKITEDGNWGPKTEAKVKAAGPHFGLTKTEISAKDFLKMFCQTWPGSSSCKKIQQELPDLYNQVVNG